MLMRAHNHGSCKFVSKMLKPKYKTEGHGLDVEAGHTLKPCECIVMCILSLLVTALLGSSGSTTVMMLVSESLFMLRLWSTYGKSAKGECIH